MSTDLVPRGLAFKDQTMEEIVTAVVDLFQKYPVLMGWNFRVDPTGDDGTLLLFTIPKPI